MIQVLTDTIITHPSLLAPPPVDPDDTTEAAEPKPNPLIRPLTKILLKAFHSDNRRISLIACTAASKLLLLGILPPAPTAEILKGFTLTYFDPDTAANPALRQALSYFLPVFCHSKLTNAMLMAQTTVPVISKLLLMREEDVEEEADEMVGWPVITAHLAEWTDGRKVVGASELGLDGKTSTSAEAEEPHIHLGIEILERALTNTCSKDERKPLLALLGKLYFAASSSAKTGEERFDDENLRTFHGLVSEAVEGKIGMDATQRNYLAKLELSLTKRLGEVEQVTPIQDKSHEEEGGETATPAADAEAADQTEADVTQSEADATEAEVDATEIPETQAKPILDEDEDDDTMFTNMQGEGTRMPLELDDDGDMTKTMESEDTVTTLPVRTGRGTAAVTEDDIMESLLNSEM